MMATQNRGTGAHEFARWSSGLDVWVAAQQRADGCVVDQNIFLDRDVEASTHVMIEDMKPSRNRRYPVTLLAADPVTAITRLLTAAGIVKAERRTARDLGTVKIAVLLPKTANGSKATDAQAPSMLGRRQLMHEYACMHACVCVYVYVCILCIYVKMYVCTDAQALGLLGAYREVSALSDVAYL